MCVRHIKSFHESTFLCSYAALDIEYAACVALDINLVGHFDVKLSKLVNYFARNKIMKKYLTISYFTVII